MKLLVRRVDEVGGMTLVVGDRKGPTTYDLDAVIFFSLQQQQALDFELTRLLPINHYSRKNLGYLLGVAEHASPIYETDDDNAPLPGWLLREQTVQAINATADEWLNAYSHFTSTPIWPRGFPLDEIRRGTTAVANSSKSTRWQCLSPIQQGLANGSPDVDAVWRLVLDQPIEFDANPSLYVPAGTWCPFNSQSTWWWPEAYPLMYLPSHCSFRMTDIWRSFIAQRCLWELGYGVVFHAPEVFQERNPHNLMRDFADEVSGYLRNKELAGILAALELEAGQGVQGCNLLACYRALVAAGFFPEQELQLVTAWLDDLVALGMDCAARR